MPLFPADPGPRTTTRRLTPNITTLSLPFSRYGRISIGARATLVRLTSGSIAVFSPIPLTAPVRSAVEQLGGGKGVGYVVAPDLEHHLHLSAWKEAWPDAKLLGPEGLPEKRAKQGKDEKFDVVFKKGGDNKVDDDFDKDFEVEYIPSHPNRELAFLYKPDRVLIQADLFFNLPPTEQYSRCRAMMTNGVLDRTFRAAARTDGDLTWTRRFIWGLTAWDRAGFNASVGRINGWNFETVVPCHGDTMVGDGKERFRRVFAWHLSDKKGE